MDPDQLVFSCGSGFHDFDPYNQRPYELRQRSVIASEYTPHTKLEEFRIRKEAEKNDPA
jgi:hypothetical protein